MSNPVAEIEYLLKTKGDLTGLREYVRGLQEQIASQSAAGNSTAALEQKLRAFVTESNAALNATRELTAEQLAFAESVEMAEASLVRFHDASQNSTAGTTGQIAYAANTEAVVADSAATAEHNRIVAQANAQAAAWEAEIERQEAALVRNSAAVKEKRIAEEAAAAEEADIAAHALGMKQLETRAALAAAAGRTEEAAAIQFEIAVRKEAVALVAKGVETDTAYIAAVANVSAAVEQEALAEAAAAKQTAESMATKEAARSAATARALRMSELKILRDSAAAEGMKDLADAYGFQIAVEKEAQALMAKGIGTQQAYVTAVAIVAEADRAEAAAEAESAAATAEKIAAKKAAAAAEEEEAAATGVNTVAQREAMVIMREAMMGRFSRIPGSASVLAGSIGAAVGPVMAATATLYIGYEAWKIYAQGVAAAKEEQIKYGEEIEKFNLRIKDSAQKTTDAADTLHDSLERIRSKVDSITDSLNTLNRVQQQAADLQRELAKTHEVATEAMHKPGENKFQAAVEDFNAKQKAEKQERDAADAEARQRYRNQLDATNKADEAARLAGLEAESTTVSAGRAKNNLDTVQFQQAERAKLIDRMQKEFGLTYEQIALVKSGKSWQELTQLRGDSYYSGFLDPATHGGPPPIDFENPLTAGENYKNFHEVFDQIQKTYGGYGGDDASQQQRLLDAQNQYDKAKAANDAATQSAHALTEEFRKLKDELIRLHDVMPAESAERNQRGNTQTAEDLKELRKVFVAAQDELIKKHFPEDSRLNAVIGQIDVKLQALATGKAASPSIDFKQSTAPTSSDAALDSQVVGTMKAIFDAQLSGNAGMLALAEEHLAKQQLLQQALRNHRLASQATYDALLAEVNDARISLKQMQTQIQSN